MSTNTPQVLMWGTRITLGALQIADPQQRPVETLERIGQAFQEPPIIWPHVAIHVETLERIGQAFQFWEPRAGHRRLQVGRIVALARTLTKTQVTVEHRLLSVPGQVRLDVNNGSPPEALHPIPGLRTQTLHQQLEVLEVGAHNGQIVQVKQVLAVLVAPFAAPDTVKDVVVGEHRDVTARLRTQGMVQREHGVRLPVGPPGSGVHTAGQVLIGIVPGDAGRRHPPINPPRVEKGRQPDREVGRQRWIQLRRRLTWNGGRGRLVRIRGGRRLVGIDPTGSKFRQYYAENLELIPDFFNADAFVEKFGDLRAKVVTSFSMFYDLEDPIDFMRQIKRVLHDDGIWVFEQSYMPSMLATNSYDTVCHEHLEYYALAQILWMVDKVGLEVVDVELNDVNGGSFSITAQHRGGRLKVSEAVGRMIESERLQRLDDLQTYRDFATRVETSRRELIAFLTDAKAKGKTVAALGASTKGNVVLQYCGVDESLIFAVGEINPDKFGSFTPGSDIPIANEADVLRSKPDYVLVLPWHFRRFFETQPRYAAQKLVYPLPVLVVP